MKSLLFTIRMFAWFVIVVLTLELCARTEDRIRYGAPFTGNYSMDSLYRYDELGKYGRPNSSYLKWHLNEYGYRGPSLREHTYRIATVGASETFGLYETAQKEWPRQLEDILNRRSGTRDYEVIDVAYPGLSIGTSLRRVPQMVTAVNPKLVVIYPSYSNYIEYDKPAPWPVQTTAHPQPKPEHPHFEWRLAGRLDIFLKAAVPTGIQDWIRGLQVRRAAQQIKAISALPQQNVTAFETDLDHLTTDLQSRGIQVVLVTHATRFGVGAVASEDAPVLTSWRKFYPSIEEQGLLDMERRMSAAVREVGAARGVPVVDGATLIPPGKQNFAEFVHFTDAGAKLLATLVADQIDREAEAGTIAAPPPAATAQR